VIGPWSNCPGGRPTNLLFVQGKGDSSMQVNISGVHLEVTDALRDYIEEKFDRLARHFDRIISVQVILQVEKLKQKAEATLHVAGREVVAIADHEDMYAAVDLLVDKLDRQLIKHKEKQLDHTQGAVTR
jgi:putative sigma-54 modulation protein|tara:strand:+ start:1020 stop:1406 length:387 start_codon:yes stop_codon:yes gene_type:complete